MTLTFDFDLKIVQSVTYTTRNTSEKLKFHFHNLSFLNHKLGQTDGDIDKQVQHVIGSPMRWPHKNFIRWKSFIRCI